MAITSPVPTWTDRRNGARRQQLLHRILAEFREMPCLRLTRGQAQRLFGLNADVAERVLATLIREGTLTCGPDGRYGIRDGVVWQGTFPRHENRTSR